MSVRPMVIGRACRRSSSRQLAGSVRGDASPALRPPEGRGGIHVRPRVLGRADARRKATHRAGDRRERASPWRAPVCLCEVVGMRTASAGCASDLESSCGRAADEPPTDTSLIHSSSSRDDDEPTSAPVTAGGDQMERSLDPARLGDHIDRLYRAAWALCRFARGGRGPCSGDLCSRARAPPSAS